MLKGTLLDYSTLFGMADLLSGMSNRSMASKPILEHDGSPNIISWELRCLEIVIEAFLLHERVFTTAKLRGDSESPIEQQFHHEAMKFLPAEMREAPESVGLTLQQLSGNEHAKQRYWALSKSLLHNSNGYSLDARASLVLVEHDNYV